MDFRPLSEADRETLTKELQLNAESGGRHALRMDPRDTSFRPQNRIAGLLKTADLSPADEVTDEEVIAAIGSVPCHY